MFLIHFVHSNHSHKTLRLNLMFKYEHNIHGLDVRLISHKEPTQGSF